MSLSKTRYVELFSFGMTHSLKNLSTVFKKDSLKAKSS